MQFARHAGIAILAIAVFVSISCEKHYVGEFPEVQRDRLAEARAAHRAGQENAPAANPTPANFFPEKKSP
ncbi:MAG: hypothetical protein JO354_08750 [Verrucomicrobia bacterium]|nr:hypothetical protein [Verrucomicrobiota bacterium]